MRRLLLVALLLQATGCSAPEATAPAGQVAEAVDADVADVLEVSCAEGALWVGGERARVLADGLHVEVAELPDPGMSVEIRSADESDLLDVQSAGSAYSTGLTIMDTVGPGTVLIRCYPDEGPRHMMSITEDDQAARVEIVDDGGHWTAPERLDCTGEVEQMIPDYAAPPAPPDEPVEPLVAAVDTTARDGAEVRIYGYTQGAIRWASIIDDGQIISRSTYVRDGTSWRVIGSTSCG